MAGTNNLLIGQAALALGVSEAVLRKLSDRGVIDVPRAGAVRVFPADRIDAYRAILRQGGYVGPAHPSAAR